MRNRSAPKPIDYLLMPVIYFAAAKISQLTVMPEGIAMLWLPNAVLLTALIRFQGRGMFAFFVLTLASEVLADWTIFTIVEALIFGVTNVFEATIAYVLLKTWRFDPRFVTTNDLLKFVAAGPIVAAFVAASCGALAYRLLGNTETPYFEYMRIWWFGDGLGLLILVPALLTMSVDPPSDTHRHFKFSRSAALAVALVLAMFGLLILSWLGKVPSVRIGPVLILPFVLFAATRFSLRWTALMVIAIAYAIIGAMVAGLAPFGELQMTEVVVHAQEFILVMTLLAMGLAALLAQLRARQDEVAALNAGLEARVDERTRELERALAEVKQLQGLLPICSSCKKIRDEKNCWHQLEKYITERSEARFSHGICPDCLARELQSS